jgi:NAD(P)H dehydrogenase (quinone)
MSGSADPIGRRTLLKYNAAPRPSLNEEDSVKIAILGASGQLGEKTLRAVVDGGFPTNDVIAAVRSPDKMTAWKDRGVDVRHADYNDVGTLGKAFGATDDRKMLPS